MVAGAKARNTNKELKEMSKLVRRYFIIVEKAFKNHVKWNHSRKNMLINSVILGISATQYRKENNISSTDQIQFFSDDQLDDVGTTVLKKEKQSMYRENICLKGR